LYLCAVEEAYAYAYDALQQVLEEMGAQVVVDEIFDCGAWGHGTIIGSKFRGWTKVVLTLASRSSIVDLGAFLGMSEICI
jgi:hypothetical protein